MSKLNEHWVLVPVAPTTSQIINGSLATAFVTYKGAGAVYRAMLDAAPPPPSEEAAKAEHHEARRCEDCPPVGYPTDRTRCIPCDRRLPDDGTCVRCGSAPRNASGLCATCVDEDAVRAGEIEGEPAPAVRVKRLEWHEADRHAACADLYSIDDTMYENRFALNRLGLLIARFSSIETAKAAAQADYERRILSALEPTPAQEPRGGPTPGACSCGQPDDEEPVAWMIIAPGCVCGPTETMFENAIHRAQSRFPHGTSVEPVYLRPSNAFERGARAKPSVPSWWKPSLKLKEEMARYRKIKADLSDFDGDRRGIAAALEEAGFRVLGVISASHFPDDECDHNSDIVSEIMKLLDDLIPLPEDKEG